MSQLRCPYCGGSDGRCTTSPASGRFVTECKSCGRVMAEHRYEVEEIFVERAQDSPLCIVTPDFSEDDRYRTPPLEDDPFENIGFITAFSTWSLELAPLFTTTTSSFCGHLAELERVLLDPLCSPGAVNPDSAGGTMSMVDNLRAYFQIVEVSSLLVLERDISDHALQLFRDCSSTAYMRNRNIEALATAALVQAMREAKEPRTLQEISTAANIPQKEIHRYMKVLSDALKLSQPINSNSISVYMPRFCGILELEKSTQDLATHIGEVVMNKSFCTRRNPISISAAAIYLSCQLEDKRKTQTEICKATVLTEVTLRKVYKELLENLTDLLPANYTPAVPPEKAFPVVGSALGGACATRGPGMVSSMAPLADLSVAGSASGPVLSMSSSTVRGTGGGNNEMSSGAASSYALPSPLTLAQGSGCLGSSNSIPTSQIRNPPLSPINGSGNTNHSVAPLVSTSPTEAASQDRANPSDIMKGRDPDWAKEERDRLDADSIAFGASKLPSVVEGNSFGHPFNPFQPFFPDLVPSSWPLQALYGASPVRPEETVSGNRDDRGREDGSLRLGLKGSQFISVTPSSTKEGNAAMSSPMKPFQLMGFTDPSLIERDLKDTRERDKVKGQEAAELDRRGDASSSPVSQGAPRSTVGNFNFVAPTAANIRSPSFQGFPLGMWGFNPVGSSAPGVFPQQVLTQRGGMSQGLSQVAEVNSGVERGAKADMTAGQLSFQGHVDSSVESISQLSSGLVTSFASGSASQPSISQTPLPGSWPPLPHLFMSSAKPNNVSGEGNSESTSGVRRFLAPVDGLETSSGFSVRYPSSAAGISLPPLPTTDFLPKLSMGINIGMQASSATDGTASQRSEENGKSM